ncbi:MAG: ABC transporter substrate-binding protein [Bacteroides sp.]|nr:ABC transporter substrate-binding protein [Bacteroides sp.]
MIHLKSYKTLSKTPVFLLTFLLFSCTGKKGEDSWSDKLEPVTFNYTAYLSADRNKDFTRVIVRNPWDSTQVLQTYLLIPKAHKLPEELPEGVIVRTPLTNTLVYSSVHCSLLNELGAFDRIGGVCELQYFSMPEIHEAYAAGRLVDAGDSMNPDIEKIIDMDPEAIILSPFENSGGYGRVEKLGIPIIEGADYMEVSPLARAEWMRFYGMLYGCEVTADSLFSRVEADYNKLKMRVMVSSFRPSVLSELKSGSAWYVPGGKSTMGIFFADAGARYLWSENENTGSVPLAFEAVFERGENADFWLIKYFGDREKTYRDLEKEYALYANFKAFRERNIYGCNTAMVPLYEEFPFHPELLLHDMINIFHPGMLENRELRYFSRLKE